VIVIYVAALSAGLLLGVYAMLYGVERGGGTPGHAADEPRRTRLSLPAMGAALAVFGATGYALARWTTVGEPRRALAAVVAAGVIAAISLLLVGRWAREPSTEHGDDPRFFLQGHPARVTSGASESSAGEIAYEMDGARHATPARSTDGAVLIAGTDVVIERIENGVAYVEAWTQVERRI
jgi:hypothetical protein